MACQVCRLKKVSNMSARLALSQLCGCCGLRSVNVHSNLLAQLAWFGDSHMWCPCSIVCHRVQQTALLSYYYLNAHKHWRVAGSHILFFCSSFCNRPEAAIFGIVHVQHSQPCQLQAHVSQRMRFCAASCILIERVAGRKNVVVIMPNHAVL